MIHLNIYVKKEGGVIVIISICDDNVAFIEELKRVLYEDKRISKILTYNNPDKLVMDIENKKYNIDTVFLDIDYGTDKKGMYYANKIYQVDKEINIVYVTGFHDKYDQEIFLSESNLIGYLTKPIDKEILDKYIDKIYKKENTQRNDKEQKTLVIITKGKECIINVDNIIYLESDNHRTLIHFENETFSVYEKLGVVEKRLPCSFVRCHKSFLVNMDKIRYIENEYVSINENLSIPVSRSRKEYVRNIYFDYIGEKV